jgi:ABC-type dipeptide/oligopeptide/nickel transport system permease component
VAPAATDAAQEQGVDANFIQQQVNQLLADAGVQNPQQTGQELVQRITQRVQAGESPVSPEALDEYTTFLANNSDLTEQEIQQQVQAFEQQIGQLQQQVAQTAEEVTDVAGTTLIWAFVGLLLGAVVAVLGAVAGSPKDPADAHAA